MLPVLFDVADPMNVETLESNGIALRPAVAAEQAQAIPVVVKSSETVPFWNQALFHGLFFGVFA